MTFRFAFKTSVGHLQDVLARCLACLGKTSLRHLADVFLPTGYFSDRGDFSKKNIISEKDCIVSDDRRLSEIFNEHFINITKTLDLKPSIIATTINLPKITETFKDHPSIKKFFLSEGKVSVQVSYCKRK